MADANSNQLPQVSVRKTMEARRFLLNDGHHFGKGIVIPSTAVDSGNSGKTNILRPGLILVKVIAAGANQNKFVPVGHADAPAFAGSNLTQGRVVILMDFVNMNDEDAVAQERGAFGVLHGHVEVGQIIYGTATGSEITELQDALPTVLFEADNL